MTQFWYTVAGRRMVEGTMPEIARNLDRIANALEKMALEQETQNDIIDRENTIREYPRCEWCDHRHFPGHLCVVGDCECKE